MNAWKRDWTLDEIKTYFKAFPGGEKNFRELLADPIHCESLAHGAWMANEGERYSMYTSLAKLGRA